MQVKLNKFASNILLRMYAYTNKCFTPDWTLIIAQKSTVVKIDGLCSDILADRLLGRTLYTVCNRAR